MNSTSVAKHVDGVRWVMMISSPTGLEHREKRCITTFENKWVKRRRLRLNILFDTPGSLLFQEVLMLGCMLGKAQLYWWRLHS